MAGFGDITGGRGGFGMTYPTRFGTPNSEQVAYMPRAEEWAADWQRRWDDESNSGTLSRDAEIAKLSNKLSARMSANGSDYAGTVPWLVENAFGDSVQDGRRDSFARDAIMGNDKLSQGSYNLGKLGITEEEYNRINTAQENTPDFTQLLAEREAMLPLMEIQSRGQSAYDYGMMGGNQLNGVLSENYSKPGFGQITGAAIDPMADPNAGVNMSWATGTYSPAQGGNGVYGAAGGRRARWGL